MGLSANVAVLEITTTRECKNNFVIIILGWRCVFSVIKVLFQTIPQSDWHCLCYCFFAGMIMGISYIYKAPSTNFMLQYNCTFKGSSFVWWGSMNLQQSANASTHLFLFVHMLDTTGMKPVWFFILQVLRVMLAFQNWFYTLISVVSCLVLKQLTSD